MAAPLLVGQTMRPAPRMTRPPAQPTITYQKFATAPPLHRGRVTGPAVILNRVWRGVVRAPVNSVLTADVGTVAPVTP